MFTVYETQALPFELQAEIHIEYSYPEVLTINLGKKRPYKELKNIRLIWEKYIKNIIKTFVL